MILRKANEDDSVEFVGRALTVDRVDTNSLNEDNLSKAMLNIKLKEDLLPQLRENIKSINDYIDAMCEAMDEISILEADIQDSSMSEMYNRDIIPSFKRFNSKISSFLNLKSTITNNDILKKLKKV